MKFSTPIKTAILMTTMLPASQVYAHQAHMSTQASNHYNVQKKSHFAPELFNDFGIEQTANKVLPLKAVKGKNRRIKVDMDLLVEGALTLTLFDNKVITIIRDRLIDKVKGSTTWIGHIEGELDSEVFLTRRGKSMSGTVRIAQELYEINFVGNGLHEVTQVDPSKNPALSKSKTIEDFIVAGGEVSDSSLDSFSSTAAEISGGTVIDVMVLYTSQSLANASGQTGIESKIVNAVAKANQAYINSNIDMQLNVVHMGEVSYGQTGNMATTLQNLAVTNDGEMDHIHALRDQYGADQVVLISSESNYCGIAYVMSNPSSSFSVAAFSVVHDDSRMACLSNNTFAHELGHNQGNQHDLSSANTAGSYEYSYGYRLCQTGGFRTVMSYSCSGGTRVGHFSNPSVLYNGDYTGTNNADNARSMTNNKAIVAAFRGSVDISTPNAPSGLAALALSDAEISISWLDNSNNETGFRLERSVDGVNWSEFAVVASNVKSFTDTGLESGTAYQYRVRAYNGNGNSDYSNGGSATTKVAVVEACINNAPVLSITPSTVYSQSGASITYNITLNNRDSSVCSASAFTLTTSEGAALGIYVLSAGSSTNASWVTTAPMTDGSYTKSVTVTAVDHTNVTQSADIIVDGTAPTAPSNLAAIEKRKSQVGITWNASADTGSGFDHYVIKRNGAVIATTSNTTFTDKPGSGVITYTVDAYDKVGNSKGSSTSITVGSSSTGGGSKGKGGKK